MPSILVIDDELMMCDYLRHVLEGSGHTVRRVQDGRDGIRLYRQEPADLVICDIMLGAFDGITTMLELRRFDPHVRLIAMTGNLLADSLNSLCDAELCGAVTTLAKPFNAKRLLEVVDAAMIVHRV